MFRELCLCLAAACVAHAGVVGVAAPLTAPIAYQAHPAPLAYAHYAAPASYAAPAAVAVAHPAPVSYASPAVSYAAPSVSYAAPAVNYAAPLSYASPASVAVAHPAPAPVRYVSSAPITVAHAPVVSPVKYVARVASPVAVSAPVRYVSSAPVAVAAHAPAVAKIALANPEPVDPNPSYQFSYSVHDASTGDSKSQEEFLQDGVLSGRYSLAEPDGSIRTVTYTADKVNGFNAHVEKTPGAHAAAAPATPTAPAVEPEAEFLA